MDGRVEASLRVRARHVRRDLDWLLWVAGTSVDDSRSLMGVGYLAYMLVLGVIWALFSWAALEHFLARLLASMPASFAHAPLEAVLVTWCMTTLVRVLRAFRRPPFRLLAADVSWLLGSGPAIGAMVFSDVALRCMGSCILAALVGLLATSSEEGAMRAWAAVLSALAGLCATVLPYVVAEARLARGRVPYVVASALAIVALLAMGIAATLPWGFAMTAMSLLLLAGLLTVALAFLWGRVRIPALACETAYGMEPAVGRWMRLTNCDRYRELVRDARLAQRGRLIALPLGRRGWRTLVSRAVLVHLRRFEGLGDILLYAGVLVPLLCALCLGTLGIQLLVPCAAAVVLNYRSARELVRVFCMDEDNRLIRPLLPLGTLRLLVTDSLPTLSLAILASCLVCIVALGRWDIVPHACAIAVLLDVATVVCGGLSRVTFPMVYRRASFELAFLAMVAVACLVSLTGSWLLVVIALATFALAGGMIIALGHDAGT